MCAQFQRKSLVDFDTAHRKAMAYGHAQWPTGPSEALMTNFRSAIPVVAFEMQKG